MCTPSRRSFLVTVMIYRMLLQMINGLLQRLAQKEKKVTELLGEIDRLKIQNSGEAYDPVSRPLSLRCWIRK